MIFFDTTCDFSLTALKNHQKWVADFITVSGFELGDLGYIFCDDEYLLQLNQQFLSHDTYTDIISFDATVGKIISGEIYISVPRVLENAKDFQVDFEDELRRVMIHGVLHFMGWKDKTAEQKKLIREKETETIKMFLVEQT